MSWLSSLDEALLHLLQLLLEHFAHVGHILCFFDSYGPTGGPTNSVAVE